MSLDASITTELLSMPLDERLAEVMYLEKLIFQARLAAVAEARAGQMSWEEIGELMGMSKQAANTWFQRNSTT